MASGVGWPCFSSRSFSSEPGVDPHPHGHLVLLALFHHLGQAVHPADVAGVDADLVRPRVHRAERDLIGEMDVGHQGHVHLGLDLVQYLQGLLAFDRDADDLAARVLQPLDLVQGFLDLVGVGIGHGLDGNRGVAPHLDLPHHDGTGFAALDLVKLLGHGLPFQEGILVCLRTGFQDETTNDSPQRHRDAEEGKAKDF